jgi:hypothetical protein
LQEGYDKGEAAGENGRAIMIPAGARSARMQKAKVILLSVGAAMAYGIIHDQITARLCIEYFTLAHPPLFPVTSPTVLALCWGVAATLGVGLVLGVLPAQASQSPGLPAMSVPSLYAPLLALIAVTAGAAVVAGYVGFALSQHSVLLLTNLLPDAWVEALPRSQQDRFMAVWFAHGASYLFGVVGGAVLIFWIWNRRQRPRLFTILPHSRLELIRAMLVSAILVAIVWLRWIRSPR